jgi:3-deoxy-7-phosphoheptulonate synthase / chorismate mutase
MEKGGLLVDRASNQPFKSIGEIFGLGAVEPVVIAGPCAIENFEYMEQIAAVLVQHHIRFIRGGAYKPRSSPYAFQGLRNAGLEILSEICARYKLYSVTEVVDTRDMELVCRYADILQVGSRNMSNYELLKEIGRSGRPVLLKRGMCATAEEFKYAAEYVAAEGNRSIILCERGVRTFDSKTRNMLDICCIPILKKETVLPVIADLSHALGRKDIMPAIAKSVLAAGADGIMVEVHPKPELALSDSQQQLNIPEFINLLDCMGILSE